MKTNIIRQDNIIKVVNSSRQGPGGKTAYQVAVDEGFEGTAQEWLDSLQGPQGDQGPQGAQGPEGPQGEQGLQGAQGPAGPEGPQGPQGEDGTSVTILGTLADESELPADGNTDGDGYLIDGDLWVWNADSWTNVGKIQGPQGDDGRDIELSISATHIRWRPVGESTWTDLVSLDAITGPEGPEGPQGDQGLQGDQGPQGEQGLQGEQGPQGPQGAEGPEGPQGPEGDAADLRVENDELQKQVGDGLWTQIYNLQNIKPEFRTIADPPTLTDTGLTVSGTTSAGFTVGYTKAAAGEGSIFQWKYQTEDEFAWRDQYVVPTVPDFDATALVYKLYTGDLAQLGDVETIESQTLADEGTDVNELSVSGQDPETEVNYNVLVEDPAGNKVIYQAATETTLPEITAPVIDSENITTTMTTADVPYSAVTGATGYNYRLNGGPITDLGNVTTASIADLQPGSYVFELQAYNDLAQSDWVEQIITLPDLIEDETDPGILSFTME